VRSKLALLTILFSIPIFADVINLGTQNWVNAAKTSRADMLIIGDSVVFHSGNGWDAGFNDSFSPKLGLAGTGLVSGTNGVDGNGFSIGSFYGSAWDTSQSLVPSNYQGYVWRGTAATVQSTSDSTYNASVSSNAIASKSGYDFTIYTAGQPGGSFSPYSRMNSAPYTTLQTLPTVTLTGGLQKTALHFSAPSSGVEFFLQNATNTSILYSRLTSPANTGVTVSSWGYGGHSTLGFINDVWNGQGMTVAGRTAWLNSLVDGGSGKLNVLIAEGLNDRNETAPSIHGITPGNSTAAFMDNTKELIKDIRDSWAVAGHSPSDLSFTLQGNYQDTYEGNTSGPLHDYSLAEATLAQNDPNISFIDLLSRGISYNQAVQNGWMYDGVHVNLSGADAYSQITVNALIAPEPSILALFPIFFLMLKRNRVPIF
jgi:hypothetical protein